MYEERPDKDVKVLNIVASYALARPWAVMVVVANTGVTVEAVPGPKNSMRINVYIDYRWSSQDTYPYGR